MLIYRNAERYMVKESLGTPGPVLYLSLGNSDRL